MAQNITFVAVFVCLISVSWASVTKGPDNIAALVGTDVELRCESTLTGLEHIQFIEYQSNPNGALISDKDFLLPGNPNAARYRLAVDIDAGLYVLTIINPLINDGGRYACQDINSMPLVSIAIAELIMIESNPNCTSTIPGNRIVTLDQYYTAECLVKFRSSPGIIPAMIWEGSGSFTQGSTSTNSTRFSGIQFNAEKVMDGRSFICTTKFLEEDFGGENTASNVPTWTHVYSTGILFVQYAPMDLYYTPVKAWYTFGEVLTCFSDAVPLPTYQWSNLVTGSVYNSQSVTLLPSDEGLLYLRCQAINAVGSADLLINITVSAPTTPTTPPTTTPAPTIPPAAMCDDLTGRWEYTHDDGYMSVLCINVDQNQNGLLGGLWWNDTNEPYFNELIGRTSLKNYQEVGFTVLWATDIGVSSFAGECHKCYGEEELLLNALSRPTKDDEICSDGGETIESPLLIFKRKPITFPCSSNTSQMQQSAQNSQSHLPAKRRRRMAGPAPPRSA